ncbi:MAG: aminoglycoside phosphotransferase family protein [Clostridia bacterium]|nr:aminoglycoside phosphotransferase family protein [Clostridia bacterium]
METNQLFALMSHFDLPGEPTAVLELKSGNINATFRVTMEGAGTKQDFILQRINTYVFREPQRMMENIVSVTDHLRRALQRLGEDTERSVLRVIPTKDGQLMYTDDTGCWRVYPFIADAFAYDAVDAAAFLEVGRGFGRFQRLLADYPADQLFESIPDFHNTAVRYAQLDEAIRRDAAGRADEVQPEIAFLMERREALCGILPLIENGTLPLRVTHNDTKSNNVMLDKATGKALCVIDLDTVMPGSVLFDYGDAIRFGASTAPEDEPDTSKIALDLQKTEAFTRGFVQETNGFLTQDEMRLLPFGIEVITAEMAMRFLADYLNGDIYFKTDTADHNLRRARAQITLLRDTEGKREKLREMMKKLIK